MSPTKIFLIVSSLVISITALQAQSSKPVVEGSWKIKSLKDGGKMIDMSAKETSIAIDSKGKTLAAYVGCNRHSANFEFITSDMIKPLILTATRKSCSDNLEALESSLRFALEETNSVRKNGAKIEFYKSNDLLMVLERIVDNGKKKKK